MNNTYSRNDDRILPSESFISCLCCIPRAWTLFANENWVRIFESHSEGLKLMREFRREDAAKSAEPVSFTEKISAWLDEAVWNDEFDHLIVVAPALMLDFFNNKLSQPVIARTIAEIDWPSPGMGLAGSPMVSGHLNH